MKKGVLILIVVDNLKGIEVNCHNSVFWMFIAVGGQTRSNEEIVDNFADVFNAREEGYVIGMAMPVELSPDDV